MPARQRRVGLQELGLPYAADAAVTRHLARFLTRQSDDAAGAAPIRRGPSGLACPTHVLFNGGVMKAEALRDRVVEVLSGWLRAGGVRRRSMRGTCSMRPTSITRSRAARRTTAWPGAARGIRIRSGASRTYYVGIESAMPAVPGMPAPLKALVRRAVRHGGRHQRVDRRP